MTTIKRRIMSWLSMARRTGYVGTGLPNREDEDEGVVVGERGFERCVLGILARGDMSDDLWI